MNFVDSVKTCLVKKYCNLNGRASRSEYWWFAVACSVINTAASMLDRAIANPEQTGSVGIISVVVYLALLLPNLGVSVRRLHDLNKTGWWLLILFVPIIGVIVYLVFMIMKGTNGVNSYGNDPLESENTTAA